MNVIFDLGGVVVAWQPDDLIARLFPERDTRAAVKRGIIGHPDWLALDRGTIATEEVIVRGAQRTGLPEAVVSDFLRRVAASLVADSETVELLHRVKAAGNTVYCLSNMPKDSIEHLESAYSFWGVFDDVFVSSRLGLCKPEPDIYRHVLETAELVPSDSVFIDDTVENLHAAALFGIHTIHFTSASTCEAELRRLGCL